MKDLVNLRFLFKYFGVTFFNVSGSNNFSAFVDRRGRQPPSLWKICANSGWHHIVTDNLSVYLSLKCTGHSK